MICVVSRPVSEFEAVKITGNLPVMLDVGVQRNVPVVRLLPVETVALWPLGSAFMFAVSDWMLAPSGSFAVTVTVSCWPGVAVTVAGATTTGGRFVFETLMVVVDVSALAFAAMKRTV